MKKKLPYLALAYAAVATAYGLGCWLAIAVPLFRSDHPETRLGPDRRALDQLPCGTGIATTCT